MDGRAGRLAAERAQDLVGSAALELGLCLHRLEGHVRRDDRPRVVAERVVLGERLGLGDVECHAGEPPVGERPRATTRRPNPSARSATLAPIRPIPTSVSCRPRNEWISPGGTDQPPPRTETAASTMRRAAASISATVWSATSSRQ
jgi:hypothetical protein